MSHNLGLPPQPDRRALSRDWHHHPRVASSSPSFLGDRRAHRSPESVGLPAGGRRRTPGLRREEISQLAGDGRSWHNRFEDGRDITPSASVLDGLARVLDPVERAPLFGLAGVAPPLSGEPYPTEAPDELTKESSGERGAFAE